MFLAHCWPNFVAALVFSNLFFCPDETASAKKLLFSEDNSAFCEAGNTAVLETGVCIRVKALFISPAVLHTNKL